MAVQAELENRLKDEILNVIRSKFDLDANSSIEVKSIEVDQADHKILIELVITTSEKPAALARSYIGLTGKVREALGADWSGFFPVISPQINSGLHA